MVYARCDVCLYLECDVYARCARSMCVALLWWCDAVYMMLILEIDNPCMCDPVDRGVHYDRGLC